MEDIIYLLFFQGNSADGNRALQRICDAFFCGARLCSVSIIIFDVADGMRRCEYDPLHPHANALRGNTNATTKKKHTHENGINLYGGLMLLL